MRTSSIAPEIATFDPGRAEREDAPAAAAAAHHQSQSSASRNPIPLEKWGKIFPRKENAMMKCVRSFVEGMKEGLGRGEEEKTFSRLSRSLDGRA